MYGRSYYTRPTQSLSTYKSQGLASVEATPTSRRLPTKPKWSQNNIVSPVKKKSVTSVRSADDSFDDDLSDISERPTASQHPCVHNMGLIAVFLCPIALIGMAVAIATNYWFLHDGNDIGLFVYCQNWTKSCGSMTSYVTSQTASAQAAWNAGTPILVTGTALMLVAALCLLCYPCHARVNFTKVTCGGIIAAVMMIGCILTVTGTSLFVNHYFSNQSTWQIQWSFFIGCGSTVGLVIPTILFLTHVIYTGCLR